MTSTQLLEAVGNLSFPTCSHGGNGLQREVPAPFQYRIPLVRTAIWEMKYRGNKKVIRLLAEAMRDFVIEEISEEWLFNQKEKVLLIPIPLSKTRRRFRGFNQVEEFIKALMEVLPQENFEPEFHTLQKTLSTTPQSKTKNRKERLRNQKGVFKVTNPEKIKGRTIILLDDVTTTGATLKEAAGALKASGARLVLPLAIAH